MKLKTTHYIWAAAGVLLFTGIILSVTNNDNAERGVSDSATQPQESNQSESTEPQDPDNGYDNSIEKNNPEAPYQTTGPDAEDSNYFIKGQVPSLTGLTNPEKNATVVFVSAPWCHICHEMRPFVADSVNKFADKIAIREIDLESNLHIARDYSILGTPAFFVINSEGNIIFRFSGADQETFESHLEKASRLN